MSPQIITLDTNVLNAIDMSAMEAYTTWKPSHTQFFTMESGKEHYRLLTFLANEVSKTSNKPIIDIGTYLGFSALALSTPAHGPNVISYDIIDCIPDDETSLTAKSKSNIDLRITDCLNELDTLINTDLICLDVAHDTFTEQEVLTALKANNYKGLLFLDDIHLNKAMDDWWNSIDKGLFNLPKYDVSKYGHWSGSGLVVFDPSKYSIQLQ
jgi:predicted O-methyltransferase YrrM